VSAEHVLGREVREVRLSYSPDPKAQMAQWFRASPEAYGRLLAALHETLKPDLKALLREMTARQELTPSESPGRPEGDLTRLVSDGVYTARGLEALARKPYLAELHRKRWDLWQMGAPWWRAHAVFDDTRMPRELPAVYALWKGAWWRARNPHHLLGLYQRSGPDLQPVEVRRALTLEPLAGPPVGAYQASGQWAGVRGACLVDFDQFSQAALLRSLRQRYEAQLVPDDFVPFTPPPQPWTPGQFCEVARAVTGGQYQANGPEELSQAFDVLGRVLGVTATGYSHLLRVDVSPTAVRPVKGTGVVSYAGSSVSMPYHEAHLLWAMALHVAQRLPADHWPPDW
jgi:hypothetical protein